MVEEDGEERKKREKCGDVRRERENTTCRSQALKFNPATYHFSIHAKWLCIKYAAIVHEFERKIYLKLIYLL